jgi:hypothetical protein
LRIDNQRSTVRDQLNSARRQLHRTATPPAPSNPGPQENHGHETRGPSQSPHRPSGDQESGGRGEAPPQRQSHPQEAFGAEQPGGRQAPRGQTGTSGSASEAPNGGTSG